MNDFSASRSVKEKGRRKKNNPNLSFLSILKEEIYSFESFSQGKTHKPCKPIVLLSIILLQYFVLFCCLDRILGLRWIVSCDDFERELLFYMLFSKERWFYVRKFSFYVIDISNTCSINTLYHNLSPPRARARTHTQYFI